MKTKEELIRIYSAYLPYGLRFQTVIGWEKKIETLESFDIDYLDGRLVLNSNPYFEAKNVKPILYNLSYLTKEIEHEGEKIIPIVEILKKASVFDLSGCEFGINEEDETIYVDAYRYGRLIDAILYDSNVFIMNKEEKYFPPQKDLNEMLLEFHINVFGLEEDQFINKATLNN